MTDEPEIVTRKKRIDPLLKSAGWTITPFTEGMDLIRFTKHALEEYPTENGPADYALCVEGKILAVIEAKRLTRGPQGVLTQAERYAEGLKDNPFNFEGKHVPFLYSTNGEVIYFHDVRHHLNLSREIAKFHTPNALLELLTRNNEVACYQLRQRPNNHPRLRPYQIDANAAIEEGIESRKRNMLIAMATGTGKTFTLVNEIYRLMKSGVGKRILFLVDRRALAAQAVKAFASFEPEPGLKFDKIYEVYSQRFFREDFEIDEPFDPKVLPQSYLEDPKDGYSFVYVCTIQRMTTYLLGPNAGRAYGIEDEPIEEDAGRLNIPIHAFDIVIADECHRGYTAAEQSVWRNTLNHFDAIKIGLTATPAVHTTSYFGEPVFRYEYERAVREGYLVDYDAVAISSDVRMNGIFLSEGEQVEIIDPEKGSRFYDSLEDERQFDSTEIERKVTSPDSNRKILQEIKRYGEEHETRYGRFPKTLIFAANDLPHTSHADQLVRQARELFNRGESFVDKITGKVDRPLQHIREFRNRKEPAIVVTVDLLSTGVDIPDLEYIVFLRAVKSRILFVQMLGRGTRKGEHYPDKSHFVVFDCFGGTLLEYFRKSTDMTTEPPQRETRNISTVIEDVYQNRDRDYNTRVLVKRLQRIDKEMSGDARDMFRAYIENGDLRRFATSLPRLLKEDFTSTMEILRNQQFQDLLEHYPRPPRSFLVSYQPDTVGSHWLIHDGAGNEYKPEDYLTLFSRFVKENPSQIEAIRILLDRPKDWSTDALVELKTKLSATKERFTVENLGKAHEMKYHRALIDLISMVKHAAREEEPLLTAEERVNRVFENIFAGNTFTPEQQQWLERIRAHLIENLSITQEDFDVIPLFSQHGGWGRANRVFEGHLPELIQRCNEVIAA
ncbi:MAG: type I restriction-modification enzyme R subunit C-terminal domain-containing protein [Methanomicrobiales archaeon]